MSQPTIGIIGGTGPQGRGLAMRFAMAGLPVVVGSRQDERARDIAAGLNEELTAHGTRFTPIEGAENGAMVGRVDFVFFTVPYENAAATLEGLREGFRPGAVFVDVTVPLQFGKGDVQVVPPPEGSGSRALRAILPEGVPFCGACKTLPAHVLEDIRMPLNCDTFIFGDDREARERLRDVLARIPGLRPLEVGGLSAAATLEGMTALLIRINRRYKSREGRFRVLGLGE
ncbi:MAG TPA: NADPH-dependent F420 reductase [bacterium]|nr:NADPH-dependent F420 reductase [bacterium]